MASLSLSLYIVFGANFLLAAWLFAKPVLIAWNIACILLLLNVATNAVLSLPARFHQFGYEQPDIALGYFPFLLLPSCLVPLVLFSNLAAIRKLITQKTVTV